MFSEWGYGNVGYENELAVVKEWEDSFVSGCAVKKKETRDKMMAGPSPFEL